MAMYLVVHADHKNNIYNQKACEADPLAPQAFTFINYLPYLTVDLSYIPFDIAFLLAVRFAHTNSRSSIIPSSYILNRSILRVRLMHSKELHSKVRYLSPISLTFVDID